MHSSKAHTDYSKAGLLQICQLSNSAQEDPEMRLCMFWNAKAKFCSPHLWSLFNNAKNVNPWKAKFKAGNVLRFQETTHGNHAQLSFRELSVKWCRGKGPLAATNRPCPQTIQHSEDGLICEDKIGTIKVFKYVNKSKNQTHVKRYIVKSFVFNLQCSLAHLGHSELLPDCTSV